MRPVAPDTTGKSAQFPPALPVTAYSRRVLRAVLIVAGAAAVGALIVRTAEVLLVIFAGVLFALFLGGAARLLERALRLPHALAVAVVVLGLLAAVVGLAYWVGPRIATQLADLGRSAAALGPGGGGR